VCSTGTIGIPLPMDVVEAALPALVAALNSHGGDAAAKAIMTTDTVDKQIALNVRIGGTRITIGGMAKGAGMIDPNMATLLAFLTTDAAVAPDALRNCLRAAVDASFNRITIDGDQSTNDTVLFLANGMAGNSPLNEQHPDWPLFCEAVREAALDLALKIVKDGEGATKFVTVTVQGAASPGDACRAARVIARSFLVKTSWYGGDPNWGRIMDAVGYSGAQVEEERVEIRFDELVAVCGGQAAAGVALTELAKVLAQRAFAVTVDLHLGSGAYTLYTCDCSEAYVRINAEYMT
jgi:glutamate N-acetyltransferase/amino-acid N-acetyltransferase